MKHVHGSLRLRPEIIVAATTTSQDVKSKWNQARQGSRKLLLQVHDYKELLVRKAGVNWVVRSTRNTAVVFDIPIILKCACSEIPGQPTGPACKSPKVAVGLRYGTVHFMDLR
jgi:hypothetical protein